MRIKKKKFFFLFKTFIYSIECHLSYLSLREIIFLSDLSKQSWTKFFKSLCLYKLLEQNWICDRWYSNLILFFYLFIYFCFYYYCFNNFKSLHTVHRKRNCNNSVVNILFMYTWLFIYFNVSSSNLLKDFDRIETRMLLSFRSFKLILQS